MKPIYSIYAGSNGSINWRIHRGSDINRRTHSGVLQTTPGRLDRVGCLQPSGVEILDEGGVAAIEEGGLLEGCGEIGRVHPIVLMSVLSRKAGEERGPSRERRDR